MSGLEIFGVIGAAATLLEVSKRSARFWKTFTKDNGGDPTVQDLQSRVEQLAQVTQIAHDVLENLRGRKFGPQEARMFLSMQNILGLCTTQLSEFKDRVESVVPKDSTAVSRTQSNMRLLKIRPALETMTDKMDAHINILQLLNSFFQGLRQKRQEDMQQRMQRDIAGIRTSQGTQLDCLTQLIGNFRQVKKQLEQRKQRSRADSHSDGTIQPTDDQFDQLSISCEEILEAAKEVKLSSMDNASKLSVMTGNSDRTNIPSSANSEFSDQPSTVATQSSGDTIPAFTHKEPLKRLAKRFEEQAKLDMENKDFKSAESNQSESIRCYEELHDVYGEKFNGYFEMRRRLKDIYRSQNDLTKATQILEAMRLQRGYDQPLGGKRVPVSTDYNELKRQATLSHDAAEISLEQFQKSPESRPSYWKEAESSAKRAFRLRLDILGNEHADFKRTVSLLVDIYSSPGNSQSPLYAETYRDLYLSDTEPRASLTVPSERSGSRSTSIVPPDAPSLNEAIKNHDYSDTEVYVFIKRVPVADLNSADGTRKTPLMNAIDHDCPRCDNILDKLLWEGALRDAALIYAVKCSKIGKCRRILDAHANIDHLDSTQTTPLMHAIKRFSLEIVTFLLAHNADIHVQGEGGRTALHLAVRLRPQPQDTKKHVDIFKLLLDHHNVDLNAQDDFGFTPLHECVRHDKVRFARKLLRANADPEIKDKSERQRTPLWIAVKESKEDMVEVLLDSAFSVRIDLDYLPIRAPGVSSDVRNMLRGKTKVLEDPPSPVTPKRNRFSKMFGGSSSGT